MGRIASELLWERLVAWGVDTVFCLPGDGINGLMEGLRRHQDKLRFILVHHEEKAAFMATGHAKMTGRLGVCLATSGRAESISSTGSATPSSRTKASALDRRYGGKAHEPAAEPGVLRGPAGSGVFRKLLLTTARQLNLGNIERRAVALLH